MLADDSYFGNPFSPGVQWRWWRLTRPEKKSSEQRRQPDPLRRESKQVWEPLDKVPSAVTLSQIPSAEFIDPSVAKEAILKFSSLM